MIGSTMRKLKRRMTTVMIEAKETGVVVKLTASQIFISTPTTHTNKEMG
jgi:hypothetical protein